MGRKVCRGGVIKHIYLIKFDMSVGNEMQSCNKLFVPTNKRKKKEKKVKKENENSPATWAHAIYPNHQHVTLSVNNGIRKVADGP